MTGSQTDPVFTPQYRTAVALLHRIAGVLFAGAMAEPPNQTRYLDSWAELRRVADRIDMRRSLTEMPAPDREAMIGAFRLVREELSGFDLIPNPITWIDQVNALIAEEAACLA